MKKVWIGIKKWLALKLFRFVTANAPTQMEGYIQERANEAAVPVVMAFLEREGILHCYLCPRRGPLIKVGPYKACPKHVEAAQKIVAEREAKPRAAA